MEGTRTPPTLRSDSASLPPRPFRPRPGNLTLVFLGVITAGLVVGALTRPDIITVSPDSVDPSGPMVGEMAPEVVLTLFEGGTWRLSEHLQEDGRPLVLNFWASWCPPCRAEIPEISAFADANPEVAVVGAAVEDLELPARRLVAQTEPRYLVGMDATGRLRDSYPSFGMPVTFLIGSDGVVTGQIEGAVTRAQLESLFD